MADETVVADPSPAEVVEENKPSQIPEAGSKEYQAWRMTGKMPKADSSPASEPPASPADKQKKPSNDPEKEARYQEILKDRKEARDRAERAEAELERLKAGSEKKPAESLPAKAAQKLEPPKKPDENDFTDWHKFQEARDQYFEELADYKAAKKIEEFKAETAKNAKDATVAEQNAEIETQVATALTKARAKHADFEEITRADGGLPITKGGTLDAFLLDLATSDGDLFGEAMYHLGSHREECEAINQAQPWKAARLLFALEQKLEGSKPNSPAKPPVKRVTDASPPARELPNGSATSPDDPIALSQRHASNPRAYIEEMNRRDIAARRGR